MTREEKELVIKDLCARLPYNVIGLYSWKNREPHNRELTGCLFDEFKSSWDSTEDSQFLPYLRPMSGMTEEEKNELVNLCTIGNGSVNTDWEAFGICIIDTHPRFGDSFCTDYSAIDWLNKNMFDYRGLIPKGLALSTEKFNPYK